VSDWSLPDLLRNLHQDILSQLRISREAIGHPTDKGDASETVWIELLQRYLPERYRAVKAHVADSYGTFSQQIDVAIIDRQYSPLIFDYKGTKVVPAESVYAVFEAKQALNAKHVGYAHEKIASVRRLFRTSLPVPSLGVSTQRTSLFEVIGGILTFTSDWSPSLSDAGQAALAEDLSDGRIDLGCIADAGLFTYNALERSYDLEGTERAATAFLFELIARLQQCGTVPMIDMRQYAVWLTK
jgi:hypothetical protein